MQEAANDTKSAHASTHSGPGGPAMTAWLELIAGAALLAITWLSVLRTVFVPRQRSSRLMRWSMRAVQYLGSAIARRLPAGPRERLLDLCAPVALLVVGVCWLVAEFLGVALLAARITGIRPDPDALAGFMLFRDNATRELLAAGGWVSMLLTLGFFLHYVTRFTAAHSRRELMVARIAVRRVLPADAEFFLAGHLRSGSWEHVDDVFAEWAGWLTDIQATHTNCPALTCYRPAIEPCWLDAAMLVLDAAALTEAVAPAWAPPSVRTILDAGAACLPALSRQLGIDFARPAVSLQGREERGFEHTVRMAVAAGLPHQREYAEAWTEFQRWRTSYAPYVSAMRGRLLYADDEDEFRVIAEQIAGKHE